MDKIIELFKNSGFTAVIVSIITVLVTSFFNLYIHKRRERQQLIDQLLPERMKAYGTILRVIAIICEKIPYLIMKPETERIKEVLQYSKKFHSLYLRNMLWLERSVSDLCQSIDNMLVKTCLSNDLKTSKKEMSNEEYFVFLTKLSQLCGLVHNRIKKGSGIYLLDKMLSELEGKPKNAKKNNRLFC